MLGVFAEFETNLRKERQLEGIARTKEAGVYKGHPACIDAAQVRQLEANGLGPRRSPRLWASAERRFTARLLMRERLARDWLSPTP